MIHADRHSLASPAQAARPLASRPRLAAAVVLACLALAGAMPSSGGVDPQAGLHNRPMSIGGQPASIIPTLIRDVDIDQSHLGQQVDLGLKFRDENNNEVRLGDYFKPGRPVILSLAYYGCPRLCTMVLTGVARGVQLLPDSLQVGRDYELVTVSFDERETASLAAQKKAAYVELLARPGGDKAWHFLTGKKPEIEALASAVGFKYKYDPATDQFAHASGIMMIAPDGKVSRYFYGTQYSPKDLRLGLADASANQVGGLAERVMLMCYEYDPAHGTYRTKLAILAVRIGAYLTLFSLVGFIGYSIYREKRRPAAPSDPNMTPPPGASPRPA